MKAQSLASNPEGSAWVSASAGSGKTKVLIDRMVRLLLEGVAPEKILCLTYTRAAASEMRQRLFKCLEDWCLNDPFQALKNLLNKDPTHLQLTRARSLFYELIDHQDRLRIMTLHGFCQSILQQFPFESSCQPGFRVLDESEAHVMMKNVFEDMIKDPPLTHTLLDHMSPQWLQHLVMNIPRYQWMPWEMLQKKLILSPINTCTIHADLVAKLPLFDKGTPKDKQRGKALLEFYEKKISLEKLTPHLLTNALEPLACLATKAVLSQDPDLEFLLIKQAQDLQAYLKILEVKKIQELHKDFTTFHQAFLTSYDNKKQKQSVLDFQDIMEKTVCLFNDPAISPWILFKITENLDHLLIDEAQDTSAIQWFIIQKITEDFFNGLTHRPFSPTLFVVGDFKQSIYGFQGAKPQLFQAMETYYTQKIQAANLTYHKVSLDVSFRSTPAVLNLVDDVFLSLKKEVHHESIRPHQGSVQRWPLIYDDDEGQASYRMADHLARFISHSLYHGFKTPKGRETVKPGDFLILVQRRHRFLYQMIRALKRYHIPVMGADRFVLKNDLIIKDIIALFHFLVFPHDTFSLKTILLSPLIGWPHFKILSFLQNELETSLWTKVCDQPDLMILRSYLEKRDTWQPSELVLDVLENTSMRHAIQERLGGHALETLETFLYTLQAYEATHVATFQGFLTWFKDQDIIVKRDVAQNPRSEVRLMTVHSAKGLQAPIVILPDTLWVSKKPPLYFEDNGYLILRGDKECHSYLKTQDIQQKEMIQQEYERLLYVALTRAENHLIIGGYHHTPVSDKCWYAWLENVMPETPLPSVPAVVLSENTSKSLKPEPSFLRIEPEVETHQEFETATHAVSVNSAVTQGTTIHKALEAYILLKKTSPLIENILNNPSLKDLLDQAMAEVPLMGHINARFYSVKIDCLVKIRNSIKIIDFKSGSPLSSIPKSYGYQLSLYKRLAQKIFKDYTIETYILWTETANLVRLS